jgi:hypothetical protein
MKKILLISTFFICFYSYGQISIGGKPYSFKNQIKAVKIVENQTPRIEFQKLDFEKLINEDERRESLGPYRYGKVMKVSYDWNNCGKWIELENGDRIWKLEIYCPMAKSINLSYDRFFLPEGGVLYIYDKDKSKIIGGFTNKNSQGTEGKPSGYATGVLFSDKIILEYYEPSEVRDIGIISVSKVVYGYKKINSTLATSTGSSLCTVDINCSPEGDAWQKEKSSVALVLSNGGVFTGSLINNTSEDGTPYFLTAHHALVPNGHDAITNPDAFDYVFWWEYETTTCGGSNYSHKETVGATVIANDSPSDFALLKLKETPYDLSPPINAFFNGWDRQVPYGSGVSIHHPQWNPKKISTDNTGPTSSGNYWKVNWNETFNGTSIQYNGSSGAPLYNTFRNKRLVGQLYGTITSSCEYQNSYFGKLSLSWNNNTTEPRRRLKDWLDSNNIGDLGIDGTFCEGTNTKYINNTMFNANADIFGCSIQMQNIYIYNGADVYFHAADDIEIVSEFEVTFGSSVQIGQTH